MTTHISLLDKKVYEEQSVHLVRERHTLITQNCLSTFQGISVKQWKNDYQNNPWSEREIQAITTEIKYLTHWNRNCSSKTNSTSLSMLWYVALQLKLTYVTHLVPKMYLMKDKIKITWNLNWLKVKKEPTNKINGQLQDTQFLRKLGLKLDKICLLLPLQ